MLCKQLTLWLLVSGNVFLGTLLTDKLALALRLCAMIFPSEAL